METYKMAIYAKVGQYPPSNLTLFINFIKN
jgi:hypothetical protein